MPDMTRITELHEQLKTARAEATRINDETKAAINAASEQLVRAQQQREARLAPSTDRIHELRAELAKLYSPVQVGDRISVPTSRRKLNTSKFRSEVVRYRQEYEVTGLSLDHYDADHDKPADSCTVRVSARNVKQDGTLGQKNESAYLSHHDFGPKGRWQLVRRAADNTKGE